MKEQFNLLQIDEDLFLHNNITLIDEIMTPGRTSFACAQNLHKAYPDADNVS